MLLLFCGCCCSSCFRIVDAVVAVVAVAHKQASTNIRYNSVDKSIKHINTNTLNAMPNKKTGSHRMTKATANIEPRSNAKSTQHQREKQ